MNVRDEMSVCLACFLFFSNPLLPTWCHRTVFPTAERYLGSLSDGVHMMSTSVILQYIDQAAFKVKHGRKRCFYCFSMKHTLVSVSAHESLRCRHGCSAVGSAKLICFPVYCQGCANIGRGPCLCHEVLSRFQWASYLVSWYPSIATRYLPVAFKVPLRVCNCIAGARGMGEVIGTKHANEA